MFTALGVDQAIYDYSGLATTATSSPNAVGGLVDTSGVKNGSLVVAVWQIDIATGAQINIIVIAAWKTPNGQVVMDMNTPVAQLSISAGTFGNSELQRVNFTGALPCAGLMVVVQGQRTSGTGNINASLSIGLELLST